MKTFKQFLSEQNYGSLINKDVYDRLDFADKVLYQYTADGFTSLTGAIKKLVDRYPYDGGTLYRGLHFYDKEDHDQLLEKLKSGSLDIDAPSSWTPSKTTAQDFARTKKSYFPTPELMYAAADMDQKGDHMTGYGGVVLKTTVKAGIGCDVSKSKFEKESEVILPGGRYDITIEELVEPYHRKYDTPEKVQDIIDELRKAKGTTEELRKKAAYVRKSWMTKLTPPQADILMKFNTQKFLTLPAAELQDAAVSFNLSSTLGGQGSQRIELDVYANIDDGLYERCTPAMQQTIMKRLKLIVKALADAAQKIASHEKIDEVDEFRINGVRELARYLPAEVDKAVKPLRQALGKRYNSMNSREHNRTLKTSKDISRHAETLGNVISAMSKL